MNQATQPVRGRGTVLTAVAVAVAVIASVALISYASAAANPVATGSKTVITLNSSFQKKLKKFGVKLTGISPSTVKGKTVTLPIESGSSIDVAGAGELTHEGGLQFKHKKKKVKVREIVLNTTTLALSGKLGSKVMKLATVKGLTATRNGFGVTVSITSLKLTGKAAKELNKKLGFSGGKKHKRSNNAATASKKAQLPFKGNQVVGKSSTETQPKTIGIVPGGKAKLAGDIGTLTKFIGLGVAITPIAPTEKEGLATFLFPITGGNIAPDGLAGVPQTSGGIEFKKNVGGPFFLTMTLNNIWVDLATKKATAEVSITDNEIPGVETPGALGRVSIADIKTEGATVASDPVTHTVSVANAVAVLQETTAFTLNSTFAPEEPPGSKKHKEVFKAGDSLGIFSFTVTTE